LAKAVGGLSSSSLLLLLLLLQLIECTDTARDH